MDQGLAVILAATMAVAGIFYTSRQQRKMIRKQHTFKVIDKLTGWTELDDCVEFAAKLITSGNVPSLCDEEHSDSCKKIDFVLNYYEFLASAIICGDVDEELVRRMEESRLTRSYMRLLPYIEENREDQKSHRLWENLEFVAFRWVSSQPDPFDLAVDAFRLRPNISDYSVRRKEIREALWLARQNL